MKDIVGEFTKGVVELFQKIESTQKEKIVRAAELVADKIAADEMVHVLGTGGHSMMPVEESMCRHEGLVHFNSIYDPGISLSHGAIKAIFGLEGVKGYGETILRYNRVKEGDLIILTSAYGANLVTIDIALEAKRLGLYVIAITSPAFSDSVPHGQEYRHPSNLSLYEIADLYIDSFVPPEHIVKIDGIPGERKNMVTGTLCQCFVLDCIVGTTTQILCDRGIQPRRWVNMLDEGGYEANTENIAKYWSRCKYL